MTATDIGDMAATQQIAARRRINVPKIMRAFRRLLAGRWVSMDSLAKEVRVLHPAEQRRSLPAIYLPGAIEKIAMVSPYRQRDREWQLIKGGSLKYRASVAYRFANVRIFNPYLYCGPSVQHIGYGEERLLTRHVGPKLEIDRANLVVTWNGAYFFGPYLMSEILLELLAENRSQNISMPTRPYQHEAGYRALLRMERPPVITHAVVRELTLFDEPRNNYSKAVRWRELRARLRTGTARPSQRFVYLKRGATGARRMLENDEQIEAHLRKAGFDVVEPAKLSAQEIVKRTLDAELVVSMEGSHLAHLVYTLSDKGTLLVFQPPDRFALPFKDFTDCLGMRFAFLVGDRTNDGFRIAPDDLDRMMELLVKSKSSL